jgi:hypothetical protein
MGDDPRLTAMSRHIKETLETHPEYKKIVVFTNTPIIELAS